MLKCPTLEKKLKCLQTKTKANFPPHKNKGDIYNSPTEIIENVGSVGAVIYMHWPHCYEYYLQISYQLITLHHHIHLGM